MNSEAQARVALFSIHPEWADAIFNGRKKVEFRRRRPKANLSHVVVYATAPVGNIVGYFSVDSIVEAPPAQLWHD